MAVSRHVLDQQQKNRISASFSRAACSYSSQAFLQHHVADQLLQLIPRHKPQLILDAGCGSGTQQQTLSTRFPDAKLIGMDLSHGMLQQAQEETGQGHNWVQADLDQLPFASKVCDLIYSNLAVQWCENLGQVIKQFSRISRDGGLIACSTLVDGSLAELRDAWSAADGYQHTNQFRPAEQQIKQIELQQLTLLDAKVVAEQIHFSTFNDLLRNLKQTGVSMVREQRRPGLTTPSQLKQIAARFEQYREDEGLPLRYHVLYLLLRKSST